MYASIMVNLDLFRDCTLQLQIAAYLAERFHAHVIGVSACRALQTVYEGGTLPGDVIELDITEVKQRMQAAEEQFRAAFARRTLSIEWRSQVAMDSPSAFVVRQANRADLLLTGIDASGLPVDKNRSSYAVDLIMHAGRPVIVVAPQAETLEARNVVIAWKDTCQSRRAITDALPFLQQADHVVIAAVVEHRDDQAVAASVMDVAAWLLMHKVKAKPVIETMRDAPARQLQEIAGNEHADLLVMGAYGHARFQEWALGGATRDLLHDAQSCVLMSH